MPYPGIFAIIISRHPCMMIEKLRLNESLNVPLYMGKLYLLGGSGPEKESD